MSTQRDSSEHFTRVNTRVSQRLSDEPASQGSQAYTAGRNPAEPFDGLAGELRNGDIRTGFSSVGLVQGWSRP